MRAMAYVIAVMAAVGIMIGIAMVPNGSENSDTASNGPASTDSPATTPVSSERVMDESGTLVLSVPKMHCEFNCYPKVKEALELAPSVTEVQLAEQAEAGTIDNRQVVVNYEAGFDIDAAIKLLDEAGFVESELVQ